MTSRECIQNIPFAIANFLTANGQAIIQSLSLSLSLSWRGGGKGRSNSRLKSRKALELISSRQFDNSYSIHQNQITIFVDILIIFIAVIFNSITNSEGMFMLFVLYSKWQCSTFKVQFEFTSDIAKSLGTIKVATTAPLFIYCAREVKTLLVTFVGKDVQD